MIAGQLYALGTMFVAGMAVQKNFWAGLLKYLYTVIGESVSLSVGQETMAYMNVELANREWRHSRTETPIRRPPGKSYFLLPAEGSHLFGFRGQLLVIEVCNACKEDQQYTILGRGGYAQAYVAYCQQEGEKSQGVTHYTPAPKAVRVKGREKWLAFDEKPARPFDSVILPEGEGERIVKDLDQWNSDEQKNFDARVGQVHKRSYLFVGPPGSGKNSCVEAIASKWRLNIYTLPLGDTTWADDDFHDTLNSIKSPCIVLLDELDAVLKKQEQSAQSGAPQGVSKSALYSFMDGAHSLPNVLIISLANEAVNLPPALFRPGRVHQIFRLGRVSKSMAQALFVTSMSARRGDRLSLQERADLQAVGARFAEAVDGGQHSAARISQFLGNFPNPHAALHNVGRLDSGGGSEGVDESSQTEATHGTQEPDQSLRLRAAFKTRIAESM
ncbi:MAG: hypothetical protein Q9185_001491 [Variospora sp. 1 TL-2023]